MRDPELRDRELIEAILKQHLGPVTAPDFSLRERAAKPRPAATLMWACLASVVLLAIPWATRQDLELRSNDAGEIRGWVRARTGVDLALRADLPPSVQLTGAHMTTSATEVTFNVDGHNGVLRVTAGHGPAPHQYTLAFASPQDSRVVCLLCHATEVN
jgi:hypothetical protein